MANAVFTAQSISSYDDLLEVRYHFPRTYLRTAEQTINDWIVYYEPRREKPDSTSATGRQCYFAIARVLRIEPDQRLSDHYYAYVGNYLEFPSPVPFREGLIFYESALRKADGSTNKGSFGRSVRLLPREEFEMICRLGMAPAISDAGIDEEPAVVETQDDYSGPRQTITSSRLVRDAAFSRVVRNAYDRTCAMTGLKLINGGGRCEIEAAHIRPVDENGPDSPRNGIALSRTVHWMFDRGILSIADNGQILMAKKLVPDPVRRLLNPDGRVILPNDATLKPHRFFLRYHRETRFKGD